MPKTVACFALVLTCLFACIGLAGDLYPVTAHGQGFDAYIEQHDGLSWLLIGRGREGWDFGTNTQGDVDHVGRYLRTTNAFSPAVYSDAIVNDLINQAGLSLSNLTLRVMRAASTDGSAPFQDLRYHDFTGFPGSNTLFTFNFDDASRGATIDRTNAPASLTGASLGTGTDDLRDHNTAGDDADRVFTFAWGNHNSRKGFSFGRSQQGVDGDDTTTFLWEYANEGHAIPYTEVYIPYAEPDTGVTWSNLLSQTVDATSAQVIGEVSTFVEESVVVWDVVDRARMGVSQWMGTIQLGAQSAGPVAGTMTNLAADTLYFFRFYGTNAMGNVYGWSAPGSLVSGLSVEQAPVFTGAEPVEDTIKLAWQDRATYETGYWLQRSTNGIDFVQHTNLPPNTTSFWDGGLTGGLTYSYRLIATNATTGTATAFADAQTNATAIGADVFGANSGPNGILSPPTGTTNPETGVSWAFGDTYQLIFITSTQTNLADGRQDITFWNNHVMALAAQSSLTGVAQVTWNVLGSTRAVDARDNAPVSSPVYLMDGTTLIARDSDDLWDLQIPAPISIDENGATVAGGIDYAWTGSDTGGTASSGDELDGLDGNSRAARHLVVNGWFANATSLADSEDSYFWAVSQELTILNGAEVDVMPPNPDPMTFLVAPSAASTNTITMTATTATDVMSPPVEYLFTNAVTGETTGWQSDTRWINTVTPNDIFSYRVKARDAVSNETAWSSAYAATGVLKGPGGIVAPKGIHPTNGTPWQVGDIYHLIFITSTQTNMASGTEDITFWNEHVNAIAGSSSLTGMATVSWNVLGSTTVIDARDNAPVTAPVYLVDGASLIATDYDDFWDQTIPEPVTLDENGLRVGAGIDYVWMGSSPGGVKKANDEFDSSSTTTRAARHTVINNWFGNASSRPDTEDNYFWAVSQPLTILAGDEIDATPPDPDPLTFLVVPTALTTNAITMTANTASDVGSPPVEYLFTNSVTGEISGWQLGPDWINTVTPSTVNSYRVKARDAVSNETAWSDAYAATGVLKGPSGIPAPTGIHPTNGTPWQVGDLYQLIFLTSTRTNVVGDHDIAHWNDHVNAVAAGSTLAGVPQASWKVLASTIDVDARDNAPIAAPVYLMDATTMIASNSSDFWDAAIPTSVRYDESNVRNPATSWQNSYVWIGSQSGGVGRNGEELDAIDTTTFAARFDVLNAWLANGGSQSESEDWYFWAVSQPLTILAGDEVDTSPPNPDPMTFFSVPEALDTNAVTMTATIASDLESSPVSYLFTNAVTGETSGWHEGNRWINSVVPNQVNTYRVKARDAVSNETAWSQAYSATGVLTGPGGVFAPTGIHPSNGVPWQVGDSYHLMFLTSSRTNLGTGALPMPFWNEHVNSVANKSGLTGVSNLTWYVVASTRDIDARDNAPVTAPVFQFDNSMVSSNNADFWDTTIPKPVDVDENGVRVNPLGSSVQKYVWIGSQRGGVARNASELDGNGTSTFAARYDVINNWFENGGNKGDGEAWYFWAISQPLLIPTNGAVDTTAPTPTHTTFAIVPGGRDERSIDMWVTSAYDLLSPPVSYLFTNTVTGTSSGWQQSTYWRNTVTEETLNTYRVKVRDAVGNQTEWSDPASARPLLLGPGGVVAPTGINPLTGTTWTRGDRYHLAFVTRNGTDRGEASDGLGRWNEHVNNVALSSSATGISNLTWYAIASSAEVDARSNALVSVPVYLLDGNTMIASNFNDMWDGSLQAPIQIDENAQLDGSATDVWTGSEATGDRIAGLELDSSGNAQVGRLNSATAAWMNRGGSVGAGSALRFYALSQPLMIPTNGAVDVAPPEPVPLVFADTPEGLTETSIMMRAAPVYDMHSAPVAYYFENMTSGATSGWQRSLVWVDTVPLFSVNTYRFKARDAAGLETGWSAPSSSAPILYGPYGIPAPSGSHPASGTAWQPGDRYQLAFVSSARVLGTGSGDIGFWNNSIGTFANSASVSNLSRISWRVIASTADTAARDNVSIGTPVYTLDGALVALGEEDLWDGDIVSPIRTDENGVRNFIGGASTDYRVWTGSTSNGLAVIGETLGTNSLTAGSFQAYGPTWVNAFSAQDASDTAYLYGASEVLTIQGRPSGYIFTIR